MGHDGIRKAGKVAEDTRSQEPLPHSLVLMAKPRPEPPSLEAHDEHLVDLSAILATVVVSQA